MKIASGLRDVPLAAAAEHARGLEDLGFDVLWCNETTADPFLVLAQMALGTERATIAPNVAIAFARSPFSMALAAWDIQRASRGRLRLGLGTQVRAHVERRFSAEFEHPAARVVDYMHCLRAIWRTFQSGARPEHQGRFYRFTLINDFFNPGPIEHPDIPIDLAGVNERMCRAAGEAADGFQVHPMHSPGYLRDVVRPALDAGARTRGMRVDDLEVQAPCFAISGETEAERTEAERRVRTQVAFYASTPGYRAFLDYHGCLDIAKRLSRLMRDGEIAAMPGLVPDALLEEVAVFAGGGVLPAADIPTGQMDVEGLARVVVDVAGLPVVAGLPAGREVLPADGLGMGLEEVGELSWGEAAFGQGSPPGRIRRSWNTALRPLPNAAGWQPERRR